MRVKCYYDSINTCNIFASMIIGRYYVGELKVEFAKRSLGATEGSRNATEQSRCAWNLRNHAGQLSSYNGPQYNSYRVIGIDVIIGLTWLAGWSGSSVVEAVAARQRQAGRIDAGACQGERAAAGDGRVTAGPGRAEDASHESNAGSQVRAVINSYCWLWLVRQCTL